MIPGKILSIKHLELLSEELRSVGGILVSTKGCFDLLHPSHIRSL